MGCGCADIVVLLDNNNRATRVSVLSFMVVDVALLHLNRRGSGFGQQVEGDFEKLDNEGDII
jgi:hypothetical protein